MRSFDEVNEEFWQVSDSLSRLGEQIDDLNLQYKILLNKLCELEREAEHAE